VNVDEAIAYASKDKCFWAGEVHTALETLANEVRRLRAELADAREENKQLRLGWCRESEKRQGEWHSESAKIRAEMQPVIDELKAKGIDFNASESDIVGLGDVVESVLTKFGITQDRFKAWFGLKECNCTERKKWLNNLFSWKVNKKQGE
jgi:hypothetical protein